MADEREPAPASGALDGLVEDLGFSPFSDTEVKLRDVRYEHPSRA